MTTAELAELDAVAAEGYAYEAYLCSLSDGTPVYVAGEPEEKAQDAIDLALDFNILAVEFPDDEWECLRLSNEPGYEESLCPWSY